MEVRVGITRWQFEGERCNGRTSFFAVDMTQCDIAAKKKEFL